MNYKEVVETLLEAPDDWYDADLHYTAATAIEELLAKVKRLQDKLCDWCAICPKECRKPENCEILSETPVMYGSGCEKKERGNDKV